jgi:external thioesterase TEII
MNLFCLPYAGGSRYSYKGYIDAAPAGMKVIPLELPGRGSRHGEPLLQEISHIKDDFFSQIKDRLTAPYAIYGHSMGALAGLLLVRDIRRHSLPQPQHLFFSGCSAPAQVTKREAHSLLTQDEFFNRLRNYGGCPDEVLNNQQLMCFFEPILRSDFRAVESFQYEKEEQLNIPIDIFLGTEDGVTLAHAMAWQEETTKEVNVHQLAGNHFFIFGKEKEIMTIMLSRLLKTRKNDPQSQNLASYI